MNDEKFSPNDLHIKVAALDSIVRCMLLTLNEQQKNHFKSILEASWGQDVLDKKAPEHVKEQLDITKSVVFKVVSNLYE